MEKDIDNDLILRPTKVILNDDGMPFLVLEGPKTFYVAPFRGYRFQVSDNMKMRGDMGASAVIGFGNLFRSAAQLIDSKSSLYASNHGVLPNDNTQDVFLNAFLMAAFKDFECTSYGYNYKIIIDFSEGKIIQEFIRAVHQFIVTEILKDLCRRPVPNIFNAP